MTAGDEKLLSEGDKSLRVSRGAGRTEVELSSSSGEYEKWGKGKRTTRWSGRVEQVERAFSLQLARYRSYRVEEQCRSAPNSSTTKKNEVGDQESLSRSFPPTFLGRQRAQTARWVPYGLPRYHYTVFVVQHVLPSLLKTLPSSIPSSSLDFDLATPFRLQTRPVGIPSSRSKPPGPCPVPHPRSHRQPAEYPPRQAVSYELAVKSKRGERGRFGLTWVVSWVGTVGV